MDNILCFGDSNTYGLIPGFWDKRYDYNKRYPGILQSVLRDYKVIEDGVVGRTTIFSDYRSGRVGIDSIEDAINKHNPKIIIIMLGTNDLKKNNGYNEKILYKGMDLFLNKVHKLAFNKKVIIINPVELGYEIEKTDKEFNSNSYNLSKKTIYLYKSLAYKYGFYFIDSNLYVNVGIDNEHFNDVSHYFLGMAIGKYIKDNF
ncbi:MAG: GDSL-type esterase/lipase family protein [Anaeroplasmataceae bacterium]